MARLAEAGAHFNRLEEIHREKDKEPTLTKLSEHHLAAGSVALIDAMADFIALGVCIVAPLALKTRPGRALQQGLKKAAGAGVELVTDGYRAIEIKLRKPKTTIETHIPSQKNAGQLAPPPPTTEPPAQKPIEQPNAGVPKEAVYGKQPAQIPLEVERPRALDMSAEELAKDVPAQYELHKSALEACARMKAFIDSVLLDLKINAEAYSIPKREDFGEFRDGVLKKVGERKKGKYKTVSQMTDIIRGRVNLDDPALIQEVANAIRARKDISVSSFRKSRTVVGVENGYARYHIDVIDPKTGMVHEWQIGTKQMTEFYEKPGIEVGKLDIKPNNRNIHDVEFDILGAIDEPNPEWPAAQIAKCNKIASETPIRALRLKVAKFSARLREQNVSQTELDNTIRTLHEEISKVLGEVIEKAGGDPDGVNFVESLKH